VSDGRAPDGTRTGEEAQRRPREQTGAPPGPQARWRVFAAVMGALVIPTLLWAAVPVVVPFLPLTTGQKVWVSGALVVAAEAVFWVSALLLGREVVRRYRRLLDPRSWFRKR
jgi:hypothetical protein